MKRKTRLGNRKYTGAELGRLYVEDMAADYRAYTNKQSHEKTMPVEKLVQLVQENIVGNDAEVNTLNNYLAMSQWLITLTNINAGIERSLSNACNQLRIYLMASITDYELKKQRENSPLIMAQDDYEEKRQEAIKNFFYGRDGQENKYDTLTLIKVWAETCVMLGGPMRDKLREHYQLEPITSDFLVNAYKEIHGKRVYVLEDGTRIKADPLSKEPGGIVTDIQRRLELAGETKISREAEKPAIDLVKMIFKKGYSFQEALDKTIEKQIKEGAIVKANMEWEPQEPTEDYTKWDMLSTLMLEFVYFSEDAKTYAAQHGKTIGEYFNEDFSFLVQLALADIKEKYDIDLSTIPAEEMDKPIMSAKTFFDIDFCGEREFVLNADIVNLETEGELGRGRHYGLAVLKGHRRWGMEKNKHGYQRPKDQGHTFTGFTLKGLRNGAIEGSMEQIQTAIEEMTQAITAIKGLNAGLDVLAKLYKIRNIEDIKINDAGRKEEVDFCWECIARLYYLIKDYHPFTEQEQQDKESDLKDLLEVFNIPTWEEIKVTAHKKRTLKEKLSVENLFRNNDLLNRLNTYMMVGK